MYNGSPNLKGQEYLKNPFLLTLEARRPGYKYYEVLISIRNVVGALSAVTKKISEAEINILAGMHKRIGDKGVWISFLEVPESVSIEKMLEELSSMEVIQELRHHQMSRIEKFDEFLFPIYLFDTRMIILTDFMFNSLKKALIDVFKSGGETILYKQGETMGNGIIKAFEEIFKENVTAIEDIMHAIEDGFRSFGWGIIKFQELNPQAKTGSIIIWESMEYTESSKIKCHFLRGLITGMLREMFNDEAIKIDEVKCKSEGAPYCEFQFV